jgi:glycine cleavage system aminomethyltransferase T
MAMSNESLAAGIDRAGNAVGRAILGGSFDGPDIADYYLNPYDLGYRRTVSFDHEFVGRAALERFAQQQNRTKVTLVWNAEDLMRMFGSWLTPGGSAKYLELPNARYALYEMDKVTVDGDVVGVSLGCGYLANEHAFVSLASIDGPHCAAGSQVTVVWGESSDSSKPQVEAHVQIEVRATVAPAPDVQFARGAYRSA